MQEAGTQFRAAFHSSVETFRTQYRDGSFELTVDSEPPENFILLQTFETRAEAHAAIRDRETGYRRWDNLDRERSDREVHDFSRWYWIPLIRMAGVDGSLPSPGIADDGDDSIGVPPTSPPYRTMAA